MLCGGGLCERGKDLGNVTHFFLTGVVALGVILLSSLLLFDICGDGVNLLLTLMNYGGMNESSVLKCT